MVIATLNVVLIIDFMKIIKFSFSHGLYGIVQSVVKVIRQSNGKW